jgi:hypothetical protein
MILDICEINKILFELFCNLSICISAIFLVCFIWLSLACLRCINLLNIIRSEWILQRFQSGVRLTDQEVEFPQKNLNHTEDKGKDAAEVCCALT